MDGSKLIESVVEMKEKGEILKMIADIAKASSDDASKRIATVKDIVHVIYKSLVVSNGIYHLYEKKQIGVDDRHPASKGVFQKLASQNSPEIGNIVATRMVDGRFGQAGNWLKEQDVKKTAPQRLAEQICHVFDMQPSIEVKKGKAAVKRKVETAEIVTIPKKEASNIPAPKKEAIRKIMDLLG